VFKEMIRQLKRLLRPVKQGALHAGAIARGLPFHRLETDLDPSAHIKAAVEWLERAQDAGHDRGISYGASLTGDFDVSYPETTGYIIPTFIELALEYGRAGALDRAIEMGDWEIAVQMNCGAVMGGKYNTNPTPAVFNTGQVLLGWAALYQQTREQRFLDAAKRASAWLIEQQDADGNWRRGNSDFVLSNSTLYNVKAAWGLCEAGQAGVGWAAIDAAVRNADYCIRRQHANGWFPDCCLQDPTKPLLHTIAYSMQGLIGVGLVTGEHKYIRAAEQTAHSLMAVMEPDGFISGMFDEQFQSRCSWCCLTGTAQTSIVWSQLYQVTGDTTFRTARRTANRYLMQRHHLASANPAIRGAVYGSWPVWGPYGHMMVMNWPTKFFVDALMLEARQDNIRIEI
jgi:hypothetical protein